MQFNIPSFVVRRLCTFFVLAGLLCCGAHSHAADVTFGDSDLLQAVTETFAANGWPLSDPPQDTELARPEFTELIADQRGIGEVTGLEACTSLVSLDISVNNITDISPLAGLTSLENLRIGRNHISDLTPLSGLTNLKALYMGTGFNPLFEEGKGEDFQPPFENFNAYTDLSAISGLTALEELEVLGTTSLANIDAIAGLSNLIYLLVGFNSLTDFSILETRADSLKFLFSANLGLQDSDVAHIAALHELMFLALLLEENLTDLSGISNLDLRGLALVAVPNVTNGDFASNFTNLESLSFLDSPITAAPDLSGVTALSDVNFENSALSDVSGLANSTIGEIFIINAPLDNLAGLESVSGLFNIEISDTQITDLQPLLDNESLTGPVTIQLFHNPLSQDAACNQLPALRARIDPPGYVNSDAFCGEPFFLTVNVTGSGDTSLGTGTFGLEPGKYAFVSAIPAEGSGFAFSHWEGDIGDAIATQDGLSVLMDADKTVTAVFVSPGDHTLTIAKAGLGSATIDPGLGSFSYLDGHTAFVNAGVNGDASYFAGWSGDLVSPFASEQVLMDQDKSIVATFTRSGFTLNLNIVGGGGIERLYAGSLNYASGMVVPLESFAFQGWQFNHWEGDIGDADPNAENIEVTMDQDRSVTLVLQQGDKLLTVAISGNGNGTTNPAPGNYPYFDVDTAFLSATVSPGSYFAGWEGDIGENDPAIPFLNLPMTQSRAVTAVFNLAAILTVASTGAGETFPVAGSYSLAPGEETSITANPASGGAFLEWQGDIGDQDPNNPSLSLTMDQDRSVTAVFTPYDWTVTLNKVGTGDLNLEGTLGFFDGAPLQLRATPLGDSGFAFEGWSGDITDTNLETSLIVDGDKTITGTFVESDDIVLTLGADAGGTTLPEPGTYAFSPGQQFQIAAQGNFAFAFNAWTGNLGAASPQDNPVLLTMDQSRTVTATFVPLVTHDLDLSSTGEGVTLPPTGTYTFLENQTVLLVATPNESTSQVFERWSGDIGAADPKNPRLNVVMDQDRTITAQFAEADWQLSVTTLGAGAITPTPGTYPFFEGDTVTLTATNINGSGYQFTGWLGDIADQDPSAATITLTMNQNRAVSALFEPEDALLCQAVRPALAPYVSNEGTGFAVYERFTGVTDPIGGLHWWGIHGVDPAGPAPFQACTRTPNDFEVRFFADDHGAPGSLVYSEVFNGLSGAATGLTFLDYPIQEYTVTLAESFRLETGWISIRGITAQNCWFLWASSDQGDNRTWQEANNGQSFNQKAGDSAYCLTVGEEPPPSGHSADQDGDGKIGLSELLRVIQFYNLHGYSCDDDNDPSEDGYLAGPGGAQDCPPHSSDYNPQDWDVSLSELLRLIQFYNNAGFAACPDAIPPSEDGFCVVTS